MGGGLLGFYVAGGGAGTTGTTSTATSTDEASTPMPTEAGECGVGVVGGAWQQQAAAEHKPACGRGGCGRGRGVRACVRAQRVGACVMSGRGLRLRSSGEGQVVLARGGGCVRACECVEAGRRLTGVGGCLGGGLLGFYVAGGGQVRRGLARQQKARTRHLHLCQRRQVSAAWVSWQGRGSSRPRQRTSRRAGEAGAAGGRVCVPVRELSVWGSV